MSLNELQVHDMTQGDTKVPWRFKLQRNGQVRTIANDDVVMFVLEKNDGQVKVAETTNHVTVLDLAAGDAQYQQQDVDVDEAGEFWAWAVVEDPTGKRDTFPGDGKKWKIVMHQGPLSN